MPVLIVAISMFVCALLLFGLVFALRAKDRARKSAEITELSTKAGLQFSGDPLGDFTLQGHLGSVAVMLHGRRTLKLPGPSGLERSVCSVEFPVRLPEMIICKVEDQDAVMGILPSAQRLSTMRTSFDERYVVYASNLDQHLGEADFRSEAVTPVLQWVRGSLPDKLCDVNMEWMRIRDGRCELATGPAATEDVPPLLEVVAGFSGDQAKMSTVVSASSRRQKRQASADPRKALGVVFAILPAFIVGVALGTVSDALREMNSESVCGPGDMIIDRDPSDTHMLGCRDNSWRSVELHYFATGLLAVAVMFVVAGGVSLWIAHRNRSAIQTL